MTEPARKPPQPATPPPASLSFAAIQDPELSARGCKILWALCYWAWGRRSECWPSNEQIGDLTNYSPRTVQLGLRELATRGHIYRRLAKTKTGCHRIIILAERHRPELSIVEPAGGGGATSCATPGATPCATPAQGIAPPLAQSLAPKEFEESEGGKRELATAPGPKGGGPPPPGPAEPEWLRVDNLNSLDVQRWRETADRAGPRDPLGRVARKILERWERHQAASRPDEVFTLEEERPAPGSPTKDPRGPAVEGQCPSPGDPTKFSRSGQDKSSKTEHKTH